MMRNIYLIGWNKNETMNSKMQISPISDKKIIGKPLNVKQQKYHPSGVSVQLHNLDYNPAIRQKRIENQIRRGASIKDKNEVNWSEPQRGAKIIALAISGKSKPRRVAMIIEMEKIVRPKTRRVDMIMGEDMMCAPKPQRGARIIEMGKIVKPKTRKVDMIMGMEMIGRQIRQLADDKIIGKPLKVEQQKYHPSGVFVQHHNIFYNHTIRQKAD